MKKFLALAILIILFAPTAANAQTATNEWGDVCHWESGEPWPWGMTSNIFTPNISTGEMYLGDDHFGGAGCSWRIGGMDYISPYGAFGPLDAGPQPLDWNVLYDHFRIEWWAKSENGTSFPVQMIALIDGVSWQSVEESDFTATRDFSVSGTWQMYSMDVYPGYGRSLSNVRLKFSNNSGIFLVDDIKIIVDKAIQPTVTPTITPSPTPTKTPTPTRTSLPTLTPTPTFTPNPAMHTPTPTRTTTPNPSPTVTPTGIHTPNPTATNQPTGIPTLLLPTPRYGVPTSIPAISFSGVKSFSLTPIPAPSPLAKFTLPTPYFAPYTGPVTNTITGTVSYVDSVGLVGFLDSTLSATIAMSNATAIVDTSGITLVSAPDWYAPYMPRPMADVGWTIENTDIATRYGLKQWAVFAGLLVSMPFQLLKILFMIMVFVGPLGLFVIWLLLMVPVVLLFKLLKLIKDIIIWLLNLVITVFEFVMRLFVEGIKFVIGLFA